MNSAVKARLITLGFDWLRPDGNVDDETIRTIRRYREVVKFLLARLIYNDGLVTVFAFGGIYAAGTFDMPLAEVMESTRARSIEVAVMSVQQPLGESP